MVIMKTLRRLSIAALFALGLSNAVAQAPPVVPALPDTPRLTSYTIAGTTCTCAVNFALYGNANLADYQEWVEVFLNGVQVAYNDPTYGWTITSPTGALASIARPITDAVLTFNSIQTGTVEIVGASRPARLSQWSENQGVSARNLNVAFTGIVAQLREVWDKINDVSGRDLKSQPGNTVGLLPLPAACSNAFLGFDATGLIPVCRSSIPFAVGGTSGQVQYNNAGSVAGFTVSGDGTLNTSTGALTISKTGGVAFGPLATLTPGAGVAAALGNTAGAAGGLATFNQLGTAAFDPTGTSGATVPLNNGGFTQSGAAIFSSTLAETNTALPAVVAGQLGIAGGSTAAPTLTANDEGDAYLSTANGLNLIGNGSSYDVALLDSAGAVALGVQTGTLNLTFGGGVTAASLATPSANIAGALCATSGGVFLYNSGANCYVGGGTAGGSNTQVQYNATGNLAGVTGVTSNGVAMTFANADLILAGSSSGTTLLEPAAAAGSTTATLPANTGVIAELNFAQTWSALQTFATSDLAINGGSATAGLATVTAGGIVSSAAVSGDCTSTAAAFTCLKTNGSAFGTAATQATGTSGGTLPFLNGTNTWSGVQTFGEVIGGVTTQSGTTYTFAATDCGTEVDFTSSSAVTATIPATLTLGCNIAVLQAGTAKVSVNGSAVTPATLHSAHSYTGTFAQWAIVGINIEANAGGSSAVAVLTGDGS